MEEHCDITIMEGMFYTEYYDELFVAAKEIFGLDNIFAYYWVIPFETTVERHNTRAKRDEFGEELMREWWREKDFICVIPEKKLTKELGLEETVELIYNEVNKEKCN